VTHQIQIRHATPEDCDEILRHRRGMFHDMGFTDAKTLDMVVANSRPFIEGGLAEGWYRGWFALDDNGTPIAGVGLVITDWVAHPLTADQARRAYVLNVYTYPEFRRRGLAVKLMEVVISWCRNEGFRTLWLHASAAGQPIYETMGFVPTNEMKLSLG